MIGMGTLAVALLISRPPEGMVQQNKPSLAQAIFPQPTGENGLEEYFRAVDLMNDGVNSLYSDPVSEAAGDASPAVKDERERLSKRLSSMDYLDSERAFASRYSGVYDLIVQGNLKPCVTPPPENTNPKGLLTLVRIAAVIQARAYCQSADGKQSESLDTLLNGLTFSLRSGSLNTMAYLADVLGERTLFDGLLEELPRMSLVDANRVSSFVDQAIKEPPMTTTLLQRSEQVQQLMLQAGNTSDFVKNGGPKDFPEYRARLSGASTSELSQFDSAVRKATADAYNLQLTALQAPEAQWYDASSGWKAEFAPRKVSNSDSIDDLAVSMSREMVFSYRNMVITELRRRAQLRLLGLHAQIVAFRWHKHRLPATLSDLGSSAATFDSLSGEPFVYEAHDDGSYRLFSKGRPETGIVELHYALKGGQSVDPQP